MSQNQEFASIRIVSVDHYMSAPDPKLDPCHSEYRVSQVKQVPVIRMFGSMANGTKTCVHIHGVFPYFYIPYEGVDNQIERERFMYQVATNLDKAINISFGKSNSTSQHVFKISVVKGIPIYGYHAREHQFLKIFLYNPHLVRKATNLLMNGVILARTFQTYESHVPYILQFFIDFNLYGMSFMHIPFDRIYERLDPDSRMSTSEYEIDITAMSIMNRSLMEEEKRSEYANPGIASIWNDEKMRRTKLNLDFSESLSQMSQVQKDVFVTESDQFYRQLLISKLNESPSSIGDVTTKSYPVECSPYDTIFEASFVQDHQKASQNLNETINLSFNPADSIYHFDETTIDEDKIISLSQKSSLNITLQEEDHELLDIMRQLEEDEENEKENDSILAPLSQQKQLTLPNNGQSLSQTIKNLDFDTLNRSVAGLPKNTDLEEDSDDEFLLDYTLKLEEQILQFSDDDEDDEILENIPQLDGLNDTARKRTGTRVKNVRKYGIVATVRPVLKLARFPMIPLSDIDKVHLKQCKIIVKKLSSTYDLQKSYELADIKPPMVSKKLIESEELPKPVLEDPVKFSQEVTAVESLSLKGLIDYSTSDKPSTLVPADMFEIPESPKQLRWNLRPRKAKVQATDQEEQPKPKKKKANSEIDPEIDYPQYVGTVAKLYDEQNNCMPRPGPSTSEDERYAIIMEQLERTKLDDDLVPAKVSSIMFKETPNSESLKEQSLKKTPRSESEKENLLRSLKSNVKKNLFEDFDKMDVQNEAVTYDLTQNQEEPVMPHDIYVTKTRSKLKHRKKYNFSDDDADLKLKVNDVELMEPIEEDPLKIDDHYDILNENVTNMNDSVAVRMDYDTGHFSVDGEMVDYTGIHSFYDMQTDDMQTEFDQSQHDLTQIVEVAFKENSIKSSKPLSCLQKTWQSEDSKLTEDKICIRYGIDPPTYNDAIEALERLEIPQVVNKEPFYSNRNDLTAKKEVGQTVLQIGGDSLNDLPEYQDWATDAHGIYKWRVTKLNDIYGKNDFSKMLKRIEGNLRYKEDYVAEMVASEKEVLLTSATKPPCQYEASQWIAIKFYEEKNKKLKPKDELLKGEEPSSSSQLSESRLTVKENEQNLSEIVARNDLTTVTKILDGSSTIRNRQQKFPNRQKLNAIDQNASILITDDNDNEMVFKNRSSQMNSQNRRLSIREMGDQSILEASSINNTLGFKIELENLQNARATTEVSDSLMRKTYRNSQ